MRGGSVSLKNQAVLSYFPSHYQKEGHHYEPVLLMPFWQIWKEPHLTSRNDMRAKLKIKLKYPIIIVGNTLIV